MDIQQLWQGALAELELSLSKANFTTWFKNTAIVSFENGRIVVSVPNNFTQTWFEKKYNSKIITTLQRLSNNEVREVHYRVDTVRTTTTTQIVTKVADGKPASLATPPREEKKHDGSGLNEKYIFENFVVGKNNELAHAACLAVTQKPGKGYNPLFMYGDVGLGKTHLLQAVGHQLIKNFPETRVLYVTCEKFTNEFIHAVRNGKAKEFKDVYRNVDCILIDDIQFITGKEGTQEEFFHTFNALHQTNKQIVLTSDRPPKAIPALEHRLLSRFIQGMIADIALPDLETRIAILETKCQERGFALSKEILSHIATTIQSNIRELEGALNRVIAYHELNRSEPTIDSAKNILSSLTTQVARRSITPKQLITSVAAFYDISIEDLVGQSRKKDLVVPRQIVMYLLREEARFSYPSIGHELGGRDHTTAIHAYTKIAKEIETNEKLNQEIHLIRQRLYAAA